VLTGVEFSVRSYWVCHFAGHIRNRCVARSAFKRQYLLAGRISLRAVEQAGQCLEVAIELFYLDKKLTYRNPVRFLQRIRDVVLEGLTRVMTEHLQQVKRDALVE
jgi:hypothetical protein